jgi:hypothetical protein
MPAQASSPSTKPSSRRMASPGPIRSVPLGASPSPSPTTPARRSAPARSHSSASS